MSLYKSAEGEAAILSFYDESVGRLGVPLDEQMVPTRFGSTHVLVGGPKDAPPLLIFHGGNVVNPLSLRWFVPLMEHYRVYAPDTVGHPGKSAHTSIPGSDNSYGHWVTDLLDGLGLDRVPMIGPSFGGGILLRTAALAPERIEKAVLVVPSSIAMSIWRPLRSILIPMLLYKLFPSPERLLPAVQPMFTEPVPPDVLQFVGRVYRDVNIHPQMPKTITAEEMRGFTAPVLLIGAENDVFFPPQAVFPRAKALLPQLVEAHLLKGECHYPSADGQAKLVSLIRGFLA